MTIWVKDVWLSRNMYGIRGQYLEEEDSTGQIHT
jgi:hypothetical protein